MAQKSRKPKTSQGIHSGGGRVRTLTPVELVLLGRGQARSFAPVGSIRHELPTAPKLDTSADTVAALHRIAGGAK